MTEKIDGTNASVWINDIGAAGNRNAYTNPETVIDIVECADRMYTVRAGSRKRFIMPGKETDNFGFAGWVKLHSGELVAGLGEGTHYGEWWGGKIQRGYGLTEKRFSLFNTSRWYHHGAAVLGDDKRDEAPDCCDIVPIITRRLNGDVQGAGFAGLEYLRANGSVAAPGYDNPEGVMVYHTAANQVFKQTFEHDETGKG